MANNTKQVHETLGEQMADLLRWKPKNFDVTFSVGPDKIKVKAVKFILKAASPVFEWEFEERWENRVGTDDNGIPLPNCDPIAFQCFVNLLILDAWSLDSIKSLNLSPNNLLNLLGLCRQYEIMKAIGSLEEAVDVFRQSLDKYKDTGEFLEISRENLETILCCENIPLEETKIYECALSWAGNQCRIEGLKPTGENYREVLGACLYQIRFPTMSAQEFTQGVFFKKNVLKAEEQLAVYNYIGSDIDEKKNLDKSQLPFKTICRVAVKLSRTNREKSPIFQITKNVTEVNTSSAQGCSVLSLPPQFKIKTSPSFECVDRESCGSFQVNQRISLHGFGFLGSIDGDAHFDVTVQIRRLVNSFETFDSVTFKKNIFARKGKIFRFWLDEPISVESNTYDSDWLNCYEIQYSLKGPNNASQYKGCNFTEESFDASAVQFHIRNNRDDGNGNPLAELLYKEI